VDGERVTVDLVCAGDQGFSLDGNGKLFAVVLVGSVEIVVLAFVESASAVLFEFDRIGAALKLPFSFKLGR